MARLWEIFLGHGTMPAGLPVRVAEDGTVCVGNDCIAPAAYLEMDAYVRAHPKFKAAVKKIEKEAGTERLTEDGS